MRSFTVDTNEVSEMVRSCNEERPTKARLFVGLPNGYPHGGPRTAQGDSEI